MKSIKTYFAWLAAALSLTGVVSACQDDFDTPEIVAPVATLEANTTISELKAAFWNDAANYADTIPTRPDGTHYIIRGVVVSSDEAGNVFKSITIQDETGCIAFSINSYNLYLKYRRGQEVVIDATGMYIGKYAGLQQFGLPSFYENGNTWQVGFMPPELFTMHAELNGFPNLAAIDTLVVNDFNELSLTPEGLRHWQSRLVRFNNVHFADGGTKTFSAYKSNANDDVNRTLIDANGNNSVIVRTSGYADFATTMLPAGSGDVVGILGFYETLAGATTWQLTLIDEQGCMNFGNPTVAPGTENNPMTVEEAIAAEKLGTVKTAWVQGYIVGAVAPEIGTVTGNKDIEWSANAVTNTLVIAASADVKDIANALVIPLPVGSPLQQYGNLTDHPENYGKLMKIQGTLDKYMDTYGITGNTGKVSTWSIDGVNAGGEGITDGDGTQATPFSAQQVILGQASGTSVWVKGYIVGSSNGMNASDFKPGTTDASATNIFIANSPDEDNYQNCVPVQLPAGAIRSALNLQNNPGNLGKIVSVQGSIEKYFGQTGVKTTSAYELAGGGEDPNPPTPPTPSGDGTETNPFTVGSVIAINPQSTTETSYPGVWVKGYIVGWADMSTEYYINANTARFTTPATMATNILVAETATCTDVSQCIGVQLPSGAVRAALNLQDNPGNLGKEVLLKGDILKYSGVPGLRNTSDYKLDGGGNDPTPPTPPTTVTSLDETFENLSALPSGWTQMQIAGNKTWYITSFSSNYYAAMTGYKGTAPFDSWMMSPGIDIAKCDSKTLSFRTQFAPYGSTTTVFEVYVLNDADPSKATIKDKLNAALPTSASATYSDWVQSGDLDLSKYTGTIYIGFRYYATQDANYATWCVDDVKLNAGSTGGGEDPTPPTPPTPTGDYKGDFNSFNGGAAKASPYGTYTNATGWTANNAIILGGTDGADSNPYFSFIGAAGTLAPTLNGNTTKLGNLVSPAINGGIGKLTFKYGFAFTETKCQFRVDVKDASNKVIATETVTLDTIEKLKAYDFSLDVNYSGTFTIEITNLGYSASTSNKDRVAIWNLTWSDPS